MESKIINQAHNKKIVQQYVDAFNGGDLEALCALFAPDAEIQGVLGKGTIDKAIIVWRELITGLGMQLTIEEILSEGDSVAVRYTERGTFSGPFMGNAPTGKSYVMVAMEWFIIRNGKICRRWAARDYASQARQIGLPLN